MRGCRPLTDDEIVAVLSSLSGRNGYRDRALFTLAIKSGLRITCLLSLRIEDVWDGDVLRHFTVRKATVKGKQAGFVHPMHPVAAAALREYIEHRCIGLLGSAPLFRSAKRFPDGSPRPLDRTSAWRTFKRAYRAAGLRGNVACHSTRKTYAQKVYNALGHDLIATQQAMHHSSVTSTIQYLSFEEEKVERAILSI
jgi:integrase